MRTIALNTISNEDAYLLLEKLANRFEALIYSIKREYWRKLNLSEADFGAWFSKTLRSLQLEDSLGDLIFSQDGNIYFYRVVFGKKEVHAGCICKTGDDNFASFCNDLKDVILESNLSLASDWLTLDYPEDLLASICDISSEVMPSEQDIEASKYLEDSLTRAFLAKIQANTGTSVTKIASPDELLKMNSAIELFEKLGIITKDFVVLCSKTNQPILKVPSRSILEETPQGNNKCFICGNPLSKETIDEIISASEFGIHLLNNGYWFQVRMLSILNKLGIPMNEVHVWSDESGIVYMFCMLNSQPCIIVLCHEKLTIEDVNRINIYVAAYSISNLLMVSTEKISLLIKNYLEESNALKTSVSFIESLYGLDEAVELFMVKRGYDYVSKILEHFVVFTPVNIGELIFNSLKMDNYSNTKQADPIGKSEKNGRKKSSNKDEKGGTTRLTADDELMLNEQI